MHWRTPFGTPVTPRQWVSQILLLLLFSILGAAIGIGDKHRELNQETGTAITLAAICILLMLYVSREQFNKWVVVAPYRMSGIAFAIVFASGILAYTVF